MRFPAPERVREILADLVAIESVNPALPGGARGEIEVARYVDVFCQRLGMRKVEAGGLPGRPNSVWALGPGHPGDRRALMFEAHMDTVTLADMPDGTLPKVVDGRMYGRGACDTKGSLAAMLAAVEALALGERDRLPGPILLAAVVDEEYRQGGAAALLAAGVAPAAAIVGEPTLLRPVVAHNGVARFRIVTQGRAAHTSRPEHGRNAIVAMAELIRLIERELTPLERAREHPLCGRAVHTISLIDGGRQYNFVPDQCRIGIDRRLLPHEDPQEVLGTYRALLERFSRQHPRTPASLSEVEYLYPGMDTPVDHPVVKAARAAVKAVTGDDSVAGAPYGTDASTYWGKGRIPCVVLGPGDIAQAHTSDEWIALDQVTQAAAVYMQIAVNFQAA